MLNLLPPEHPHARRRKKHHAWPWWKWVMVSTGGVVVIYIGVSAAVFFAVKWHLTDTPGRVDPQTNSFNQLALELVAAETPRLPVVVNKDEAAGLELRRVNDCRLKLVQQVYPKNYGPIKAAVDNKVSAPNITKMLFAVRLRLTNESALAVAMDKCTDPEAAATTFTNSESAANIFPWANSNEWSIVREAFKKDQKVIDRVAAETGVPARLVVSVAMVEQLRLYFTERELFEKFFQPLKILGNATQFAWGVMAIKEQTAITVENNLRNSRSVYYLGVNKANLLSLPDESPEKIRFERLTDERDHYYSYLYGALELAQYMAQWDRAGFSISNRPEILATLFNIGFSHSRPSASPSVGGSTIKIAGTDYTFGGLAFEWYYSGELQDLFPYPVVVKQ